MFGNRPKPIPLVEFLSTGVVWKQHASSRRDEGMCVSRIVRVSFGFNGTNFEFRNAALIPYERNLYYCIDCEQFGVRVIDDE